VTTQLQNGEDFARFYIFISYLIKQGRFYKDLYILAIFCGVCANRSLFAIFLGYDTYPGAPPYKCV